MEDESNFHSQTVPYLSEQIVNRAPITCDIRWSHMAIGNAGTSTSRRAYCVATFLAFGAAWERLR